MSEITAQPKHPTGLLIWLIISQLMTVASLFIWLVMAIVSLVAFNAGTSIEVWTLVITVWSYPIFPLIMVIGAWVAYARRKNRLAAILSGLSFSPPILFWWWMAYK